MFRPQVEDEDDITTIQDNYDKCELTGRVAKDHKTQMVGLSIIHTNRAAVSPG